jgi:hypothetical protein
MLVLSAVPGFRIPRFLLAASLLIGLLAFSGGQAEAKTYKPSNCSYPNAAQVFSPWKDQGYYELAPDGGFENGGTGWTLSGGASLVEANEDHFLNGAEDDTAVRLPFGAIATSPPVCVDETTPSFRVMSQNIGAKGSKLRVTVTYELASGPKAKQTDTSPADSGWAPTPPLQLQTDGEAERIARISFSAKDPKGVYLVDDLFVDPFARR